MQVLVRRVRAAPVVATKTTVAPSRRLRLTSDRLERLKEDREAIYEQLKSISECDEAIDRAMSLKEAALAKVEELMRENRIEVIDNGKLIAELAEGFTRQSRTIDPRKFRTKVTNDQFWGSIEVSVTKAKQFLGEKELNGISDVVPSQSTGFHLKVREFKTKGK